MPFVTVDELLSEQHNFWSCHFRTKGGIRALGAWQGSRLHPLVCLFKIKELQLVNYLVVGHTQDSSWAVRRQLLLNLSQEVAGWWYKLFDLSNRNNQVIVSLTSALTINLANTCWNMTEPHKIHFENHSKSEMSLNASPGRSLLSSFWINFRYF